MLPWTGGGLEELSLINRVLAISNHSIMLGGGEHSFLDIASHMPLDWKVAAAVPCGGELEVRLRRRGVETQVLALPAIRPWGLVRIIAALRSYLRQCHRYRPALIYANGSRAAFYGGIAGRLLRVPVIWHCRIAQSDPNLDPILVRLSSRIITNSQATTRRFSPHFQAKISMIYNGVDILWLQEGDVKLPNLIQKDWKVILTVARVSKWKRHDLVLSAFEQIAKYDSKLNLVCLGAKDEWEPDWWKHLQEKTRQSPLSQRIHWVGQVDDVRPWYRSADMFVLASENEPFGRVIVEAMACGLPVIATRSGGVPEIIRHEKEGLLVSPGNVKELTGAMKRLLKDDPLRKHLISSGHQRSAYFSLENHMAKMVKIFDETIDSKRPPNRVKSVPPQTTN